MFAWLRRLAVALGAGAMAAGLATTALAGWDDWATVCRLNPNGDNYLSFRTCPSTGCGEMLRLGPGTQVLIIDFEGNWRKVELSNGAVGWVFGRYLCT